MRVALTIAGSDPSGGAGLQADLKTFQQHGVYGQSVVTLLTVQNTQRVIDVAPIEPSFIEAQLEAILEDMPPSAAKTGALGNSQTIRAVARQARKFSFPLVVDPVMISKHGQALIQKDAVETLISELLPLAWVVTPNRYEAEALSGIEIRSQASMLAAAAAIAGLGPKHVLMKGGEIDGRSIDLLWSADLSVWLDYERIKTRSTHGSGCVFSAALTARIALGQTPEPAARGAKRFVTDAITSAPGLGLGIGPVNMLASPSIAP